MSDRGAQLLPHTDRRDNRGGAVFRAETALDVCRNFSVRRHTASAPQSATTRCRIGRRVQGGRCHDRGPTITLLRSPDGRMLPDIRSVEDNTFAANQICEIVRELSLTSHTSLHASAAGGRKTMSIYLTA